jgi:hypothetical protein
MLELLRQISPWFIPLCAVLGVLGVISAISLYNTGKSSVNWTKVQGILNDCGVVTLKTKERYTRTTVSETHHVEIRYQYTVDGKTYGGYQFKVGLSRIPVNTRKEGERIASKFKSSKDFVVYYDPQKPEQSALAVGVDASPSGTVIGNFFFGIVLTALALIMFVYYRPYG